MALARLDIKIRDFFKEAQKEFNNFFGIKIDLPEVTLLNSRKEIDEIRRKKTENWLVGWTHNNRIFILKPEVFIKESCHKNKKYFWKVLKHEFCHLYYKKKTGIDYPAWLNEGLACFLARQKKKQLAREKTLRVFEYFKKHDRNIYGISYFWVAFLIREFGQKKLMELIKSLRPGLTKNDFSRHFYKVYNIRYSHSGFKQILKFK